jgi:dihydroorotase-like cyclic amidohydrolase
MDEVPYFHWSYCSPLPYTCQLNGGISKVLVNVFPIGAITKGSAGEELSAIGAVKAAGAVAIGDDGLPVMSARVMRRAMEFARSYDLPFWTAVIPR